MWLSRVSRGVEERHPDLPKTSNASVLIACLSRWELLFFFFWLTAKPYRFACVGPPHCDSLATNHRRH